MLRRLIVFSAALCGLAQRTSGVDPRPNVTDYPSRGANSAVSLGAAALSGSDQHKTLGRNWSGSYVIVEVALYPEAGKALSVAPQDFMLRDESESVAPVDAETILPYTYTNTGPAGPKSKVHVQTLQTVGVASGPNGHKTVYTDSQVQVAVGDPEIPPPPPQANDPKFDLRLALERCELPDIKTANPVAGYVYFPKLKHPPKNGAYELDYYGSNGQVKLPLQTRR